VLPTGVYQRQTDVDEDRISLSLKSKQAPTKKWTETRGNKITRGLSWWRREKEKKDGRCSKNNKI